MPAAIGLVDLGVLLALAFLIALSYAYNYSLGAAIVALANAIGSIRLPGFLGGGRILGFAADALTTIDHTIRRQIGLGIAALQTAWNECVSYTAQAVHWIGKEIASISHDTAQAVGHLHVQQITNVYRKVNPALARKAGVLAATVAALERHVTHLVAREAHVAIEKVKVVEHATTLPAPIAIPKTLPKIGTIEREVEAALAKVRDFAKRFGPAALLGSVVYAIGRIGFGWVRCSKVGKAGRQICGMNDDLLESLLADTLLVVGTLSLVEFAREMVGVTDTAVKPIQRFWRAG